MFADHGARDQHASSILTKLGVSNRTQAVARFLGDEA